MGIFKLRLLSWAQMDLYFFSEISIELNALNYWTMYTMYFIDFSLEFVKGSREMRIKMSQVWLVAFQDYQIYKNNNAWITGIKG
jgi:hypothetical protein